MESFHAGAIAVCDAAGQLTAVVGSPGFVTFARSSAKPIQAIPLVESGAADRFGLTDALLALCCASHNSEPRHVEGAAAILAAAGLNEGHLRCGPHPPNSRRVHEQVIREGRTLTSLYSNCSGKHAGMLALARHLNADPASYLKPGHPVQRMIREVLSDLSGVPEGEIGHGTDGCGAPTFALSLGAWARGFARFAAPDASERGRAMARISRAMRGHPGMVAGEGRFDTELTEASNGTLMVKGGAEGFLTVVMPRERMALVAKSFDGSERALFPAVIRALKQLGALSDEAIRRMAHYAEPVVLNTRGEAVGRIVSEIRLASC
jgi:L-asparaginase II